MKCKMIILILLSTILISSIAIKAEATPQLFTESAILYDPVSGRILFSQMSDRKRPIASTTKIMTALVTIENVSLEEVATVSRNAAYLHGSSLGLKVGEEISIRDLLFGLLLRSGNDAAVALAEHIAGDIESFAKLMTAKAVELGAYDTSFRNPHGLDQNNHYSTAKDLAIITAAALKNPILAEIVRTKQIDIYRFGQQQSQRISNINRFLYSYPFAVGVKTGYTFGAGKCLVAAGEKDGWQLIAVALNSGARYKDCESMLEWGYNMYSNTTILHAGEIITTASVLKGRTQELNVVAKDSFTLPLTEDEINQTMIEVVLKPAYAAPIPKYKQVGYAKILLGDTEVGRVALVAQNQIDKKSILGHGNSILEELVTIMGTGLYD